MFFSAGDFPGFSCMKRFAFCACALAVAGGIVPSVDVAAQNLPPGCPGQWVPHGDGMACQCPDGALASGWPNIVCPQTETSREPRNLPQPIGTASSAADQIESEKWGGCAQTPGRLADGQYVIGANGSIYVKDWHRLQDSAVLESLLAKALQDGLAHCGTGTSIGVAFYQRGMNWTHLVYGRWTRSTGRWEVSSNLAMFAKREENAKAADNARKAAEEQRIRREQERKQRKLAALQQCGPEPKISGGPWFSSTYKVAARDAARHSEFVCVSSVEYLSAAPNPFGGNAARIRLTGFDAYKFEPKVMTIDIPY